MRRMSIGNGLEMMRVRECDLIVYNLTATNITCLCLLAVYMYLIFSSSCMHISTYKLIFPFYCTINWFILLIVSTQMTIYVFFPVAVFYYFNIPEFFDRFVEEKRVCPKQVHAMKYLMNILYFVICRK